MSNVTALKPPVNFTAEIDADTAKLVAKFITVNQHTPNPTAR
jgi:hypothetical protein